jgi:hydrogenase expression/formation protein HypC
MTIPSRVLSIAGQMATVESFGIQRTVSILLMSEPLDVGDYVTIMAGAYIIEKIPQEMALESLAYLESVLDEPLDESFDESLDESEDGCAP